MKRIENRVWKELGTDLGYDIVGSILYAAGIYTFATSAHFAPGGFSGLAILINHFVGLPIGVITVLLNLPIILVTYRVLGRTFLLKSVKTMIISAVFMDLVFPHFPIYAGEPLLAALYTGALSGAGLGLIYMRGSSTGGTDFLMMMIQKKHPHLSLGQISLVLDAVVILIGGLVFGGIDSVLHGVVATVVTTMVIDKLVYGAGSGKMAIIITDHGMEVANLISEETERGATLVEATGTFSGSSKQMLFCACNKREITKVRQSAYRIDPGALVMITSYDEAFGLGFKEPERSAEKRVEIGAEKM